MLSNKKLKIQRKKTDWYPIKAYMHFDTPLPRDKATELVKNEEKVASHEFLPLIAFEKRERRFKRAAEGKSAVAKSKIRRLVYCSNKDAYVFGYYASLLNPLYEDFIEKAGISDNVIGYRKVGSNIDLAMMAFDELRSRGSCVAFAFDISGFFDNIDHHILKSSWARILNKEILPDDHYQVFRNLTSFSTIDRRACFKRLGIRPSARDSDIKRIPLCSIAEYRAKIRGGDKSCSNLVVPWKRNYRIPQGTPLSALAANIAMIDFDISMRKAIDFLGGSYRRYSDDILVIVPTLNRSYVKPTVKAILRATTRTLRLKDEKSTETEFIPGALANGRGTKPLQYLGFLFDGENTFLRSSTISKFYRRLFRSISLAKRQHLKSLSGEIPGRKTIHRRKIMLKHSHLGARNFITTYAASAQSRIANNRIRAQLSGHTIKINRKLNRF